MIVDVLLPLFRYHNDWRSETQIVVSVLAFMNWLETGDLLMHMEAQGKLGCMLLLSIDISGCHFLLS